MRLGPGAALGRGIGGQNLQTEGESLLVEQLRGCQARVGQAHDVERLQAHRLYRLSLQAGDLAQREAGDDAADGLLDHDRLRVQALLLGRGVGSWQRTGVPVDDAHCRDGELDGTGLDG